MSRPCSICANSSQNAIETELINGTSFRDIAQRYQVTASSVFRHHKEHTAGTSKAPTVKGASPAMLNNNPENEPDVETDQRLTIKQRLFVEHYLSTKNGREAAELAGYTGSDATLRSMAVQNLSLPHIRAEIDRRIKPFILSADEVLGTISSQANGSIDDLLNENGRFDLAKARQNGAVRNIKTLRFDKTTGNVVAIELYSAQDAAQLLGRKHKLFTDKIETNAQPDEHEDLKREILADIIKKYGLTEEQAKNIMDHVCQDTGVDDADLASNSVS